MNRPSITLLQKKGCSISVGLVFLIENQFGNRIVWSPLKAGVFFTPTGIGDRFQCN